MGHRTWPAVAFAFLFLAASSVPASADAGPVGPPMGNNAYQGSISDAADVDDFTGTFLAGEVVTWSVTAMGAGKAAPTLRPLFVLVDPDGHERTAGVTASPTGLSMIYKSYVIDKSGPWTARVSSNQETTGPYRVRFAVRPFPKQVRKAEVLGGGRPLMQRHPFAGVDGATFSATASWKKGYTPVEFDCILRPDGTGVRCSDGTMAVERVVTRGRTTRVSGIVLEGGAGPYELGARVAMGQAVYSLVLDVRPPRRVTSKKTLRLTDVEPELDALAVPRAGEPGDTVRFTGSGFAMGKTPPVVRFGDSVSPKVTVLEDGTAIDCVVAPRTGSAFVPIYVVNPDGQAAARDGLFAYQPPPVVTGLVDDATGETIRSSSTAGGRTVRLVGEHFEAGYVVRVGGSVAPAATRICDTEFRFQFPAASAGMHRVTITDPYLREAVSDFEIRYKTPPAFAATTYVPGAVRTDEGTTLTVNGTGFLATDVVRFDGADVPSSFVSMTTRTVPLSPLPAGAYSFAIVDEIGTVVNGPPVYVKDPGVVTSVTVASGPVIDGNSIPLSGGSKIRVDGSSFAPTDVVTLGGTPVGALSTNTTTRKEFIAPGGFRGAVLLEITDGAGQTTTVEDALRYVGFADDTADRHPATSGTDDFRALRGAVGDLDGDGAADDLVVVSPLGSTIGTRQEHTRVLFGDGEGAFEDSTDDSIPAARSDPQSIDTWDARCVALGDLDRDGSLDIVLGGEVFSAAAYPQVRVLTNDGRGVFDLEANYGPGTRYTDRTPAYAMTTYYGYQATQNPLFGPVRQQGHPTALAIGDIDADGDDDLVVGTSHFESRQVYYDPAKATSVYVYSYYGGRTLWAVNPADTVSYRQYVPALRIYENRLTEGTPGMPDVSSDRLRDAGTSTAPGSQPPALHARDLALGDIDGNGTLDLVVAWDDPSTVSAYGLSGLETSGQSAAAPTVATRILLNDGNGAFTNDATSAWLPTSTQPEYWQADRIALADLDGDGDLDLVLLLGESLDGWTGTPTRSRRALRVLRNEGNRFTDQTAGLPGVVYTDGDDFRGDALSVRDVNGDGRMDIVVASRSTMTTPAGQRVAAVRAFFGSGAMTWTLGRAFGVDVGTDSGEASDLLWSDDLNPEGNPVLIHLSEVTPAASPDGQRLRTDVWVK